VRQLHRRNGGERWQLLRDGAELLQLVAAGAFRYSLGANRPSFVLDRLARLRYFARMKWLGGAILFVAALVAGCGGAAPVNETYGVSCDYDSDCIFDPTESSCDTYSKKVKTCPHGVGGCMCPGGYYTWFHGGLVSDLQTSCAYQNCTWVNP
jgi:hypothetical protein